MNTQTSLVVEQIRQTPYRADREPEETFLSFVHFAEIFCGQFYPCGLTVCCLSTTVLSCQLY